MYVTSGRSQISLSLAFLIRAAGSSGSGGSPGPHSAWYFRVYQPRGAAGPAVEAPGATGGRCRDHKEWKARSGFSPGRREQDALGQGVTTSGQIRVQQKAACSPIRIARDEDRPHRAGEGGGFSSAVNSCHSCVSVVLNRDFRIGCSASSLSSKHVGRATGAF